MNIKLTFRRGYYPDGTLYGKGAFGDDEARIKKTADGYQALVWNRGELQDAGTHRKLAHARVAATAAYNESLAHSAADRYSLQSGG